MNALIDKSFRVLVVDDETLYAQAIGRELRRRNIECDLAYTAGEGLALAREKSYSAILLDHKLPDEDGIRVIPLILSGQPGASLVMMTAFEAIPNAIQAIRQGADDYRVKEPSVQPLVAVIEDIRQRRQARLKTGAWAGHRDGGLLGESSTIEAVRDQLVRVAGTPRTTVLLTGETGVGKEVAARELHRRSGKKDSTFLAVDCAALPAHLVESLLFGHEKGAFTGADQARDGAFAEVREGTLLLDEIGEMDLSLQGKLLRVLESRSFRRVGSVREQAVSARIVAATNRDLLELVQDGRFRFDLYSRLSVFPIHIPPLRERRADIAILAEHFARFFATQLEVQHEPLSDEVLGHLSAYAFPGNVRELKNVLERAIILADNGPIEPRLLPERILRRDSDISSPAGNSGNSLPFDFVPGIDTLAGLEMKLIEQALTRTGGNRTEAAKLLGISRFQLLRRLEKIQID